MNETKNILNEKKAITPLWIVALFVSLTETILGIAVFQTTGGVQIALTVFVIVFPLLIAGAFFGILWHKPYVFYPPTEFGREISVGDYVEAMQRRPGLLKQIEERKDNWPPNETEKRAAGEVVNLFLRNIAPSGMLTLYIYNKGLTKSRGFNLEEVTSSLSMLEYDYGWGFIVATKAIGLVSSDTVNNVTTVTYMDEKLQAYVSGDLLEQARRYVSDQPVDKTVMEMSLAMFSKDVLIIDQYFSGDSVTVASA